MIRKVRAFSLAIAAITLAAAVFSQAQPQTPLTRHTRDAVAKPIRQLLLLRSRTRRSEVFP